jgi:orotate phosphoribosyltransferase
MEKIAILTLYKKQQFYFAKNMSTVLTINQIAKLLLKYKIVEVRPNEPFTYASGIKGPIYCDARKIISHPELRKPIADAIANKIKESYPDVEVISGVATGSIALAAWVSEILNLPMIYYRKPKGYGHNNTIEGEFTKGQKVVVIEDVVSTGGSCLNAVDSLREGGLEVLGTCFIYSHELQNAVDNFASKECKYECLVGFKDLIEFSAQTNILNQDEVQSALKWHENPSAWGI